MEDKVFSITRDFFDEVDAVFYKHICSIPKDISTLESLYNIVMTTISAIVQKNSETMALCFMEAGDKREKQEIYNEFILELASSCVRGYDATKETKH